MNTEKPPILETAFVAQPAIVELAEEVSARGRVILGLQAENARLRAEVERLSSQTDPSNEIATHQQTKGG